jgi:hypothetical protein
MLKLPLNLYRVSAQKKQGVYKGIGGFKRASWDNGQHYRQDKSQDSVKQSCLT